MKKFILPLVALAFTAVAMVSCGSDGDSNTPTPEPEKETTQNLVFVTAVSEQQINYITATYTLDMNGTKTTFDLSKMTAAEASTFPYFSSEVQSMTKLVDFTSNVKYYTYDCGTLKAGGTAKVTSSFAPKSGHATTGEMEVVSGGTLYQKTTDGQMKTVTLSATMSVHAYSGVSTTDEAINKWVQLISEDSTLSYTFNN